MRFATVASLSFALSLSTPAFCQVAASTKPALPVREITVFKDGHAFLLQEGKATIGTDNTIKFTDVPNPVLGTFWPYSADKSVPLKAVVAGREPVQQERNAASIADFLQANIGAKVVIERTTNDNSPLNGTILSVAGSSPNLERGGFGGQAWDTGNVASAPTQISLVVLQTEIGILPLPIGQITTVRLPNGSKTRLTEPLERNVLNLQFGENTSGKTVDVGMMYLQKGLRWIPNYKVNLDGKGTADIALQGTLINDLIDFSDTSLNLVVGVPSFAFKDTPDPIGLQDTFARLSPYFSADSRTANNFSNAIITQNASRMSERDAGAPPGEASPEFSSTERNEDLFLYNVNHVSLKKGQRMTLPITHFTIPYRDIYTLDLLPTPPQAIGFGYDGNADPALARLLGKPVVRHQARLENNSTYPLTTAPSLLMREGRVLAQSLMTYTAIGGKSDLPITNAIEVSNTREDVELKRTSNAVEINRTMFSKVELQGTITLTNYRKSPTELEVTRYIIGEVSQVDQNGSIVALDLSNEPVEVSEFRSRYPDYSHYNKLTRIIWKLTLAPGQKVSLTYAWNYLFR